MNIYDFNVMTIKGEKQSLEHFKGKVLLIVNTASECGYTRQYKGLQELYDKYQEKGLVILAFPSNQFGGQEPGSNEEINDFCLVNFGVEFPLFQKVDVKGEQAEPLFTYLSQDQPIEWNFTKFLIDTNGTPVKRYSPKDEPEMIEKDILPLLSK